MGFSLRRHPRVLNRLVRPEFVQLDLQHEFTLSKRKVPGSRQALRPKRERAYLVLRLDERLLPELLPELRLREPLALARPPDADEDLELPERLLPPFDAEARPELLPRLDDDDERGEDEELRDAIALLLVLDCGPRTPAQALRPNLGAPRAAAVGRPAMCL